jgi:hypothetical protein
MAGGYTDREWTDCENHAIQLLFQSSPSTSCNQQAKVTTIAPDNSLIDHWDLSQIDELK